MSNRLSAAFATLAVVVLSSCVTIEPLPGPITGPGPSPSPSPSPGPGPEPQPEPGPGPIGNPVREIGWHLSSRGHSYDLDVVINGRDYHVDSGGEHFDPHPVGINAEGVPRGALSAYEIHGPDGEDMLYWAEQNGGQVLVFSRAFDPYSGQWGPERRLRTIRL